MDQGKMRSNIHMLKDHLLLLFYLSLLLAMIIMVLVVARWRVKKLLSRLFQKKIVATTGPRVAGTARLR